MKRFEKIILGLVLLLFIVQLVPDFPGKWALFSVSIWLSSYVYLIGSFWLLKPEGGKTLFIPLVAGLAFATSLIVLPYTIRLRRDTAFVLLPLLNAGFFLGLGIYMLVKQNTNNITQKYTSIFIRSAIILVVVGFFSFTPFSFRPLRNILIALNNGNYNVVRNMKMFNYADDMEDALEEGDCDRAIDKAEKSNQIGKEMLGISSETESQQLESLRKKLDSAEDTLEQRYLLAQHFILEKEDLWKISETFSNLYKAYICKADLYFGNNEYEQALNYYLKANIALNSCESDSEKWHVEEAYSISQIALCLKRITNSKHPILY